MSDLSQRAIQPDELRGVEFILQEVRRSTVVDGALREMTRLITLGYWQTGERIATEERLAAELSVGRSTVREAKGILVALGLLENRGTKGTFIAEQSGGPNNSSDLLRVLSYAKELELHEARILLETEVIRLATERATEPELQELAGLLDQMRASLDSPQTFWPMAVRFHFDLAKASQNAVLVELVQVIAGHLEKIQMPLYRARTSPKEALESHEELLNAVTNRDTEIASAEMRKHLSNSLGRNDHHFH